MNAKTLFSLAAVLVLSACGAAGKAGDVCTTDDDCEDGLECHIEGHDDHDDHDDHGDEEEDHADEDEHEGEEGVCEEAGEHEDE